MKAQRDEQGQFPSFAWPGGYPLFYVCKDGSAVCPACANKETDASQEVQHVDVNYEDSSLYCEDCNKRIEPAYEEEE